MNAILPLAPRLKELRGNISQAELARLARVPRQNIVKIERRGIEPRPLTRYALCGAMNIDPVTLESKNKTTLERHSFNIEIVNGQVQMVQAPIEVLFAIDNYLAIMKELNVDEEIVKLAGPNPMVPYFKTRIEKLKAETQNHSKMSASFHSLEAKIRKYKRWIDEIMD